MNVIRSAASIALVSVLCLAGPASANTRPAPVRALQAVEPGEWLLRERSSHAGGERLCVGDLAALLQPRHPSELCERFIVDNQSDRATVTYQCRRSGHGRTDIRVETPRLVQIRSQGVAAGEPFELDIEARRVGTCNALAARK